MANAFFIAILFLSGCVQYPGCIPKAARQNYVYTFYSPFHRRLTALEREDFYRLWDRYAIDYATYIYYMDNPNVGDPDGEKAISALRAMYRDEDTIREKITSILPQR